MAINLDHVTEQITVTDTATNASLTVQPKGTGAFNIAAGSSGLNLSNGGTVTAITSTDPGSAYTSVPTVNIAAPTTAGGVQAVITTNVAINAGTIGSGGTGYTVGNVLTLVGGTTTGGASTWTVAAVSGGVVTSVTSTAPARYTAFPSLPASVTGGSGSGFTFSALSGFVNQFVISNAGSGYVEQPTITITGGGGSSAAAYATLGSGVAALRGLTGNFAIYTPAGEHTRFVDNGQGNTYWTVYSNPTLISPNGSAANIPASFSSKGASGINLYTNTGNQLQAVIAHTASAVNYVQLSGAATGGTPYSLTAGSDTNIGYVIATKGTGSLGVWTNNGAQQQLAVSHTASAVNYVNITGSPTGGATSVVALGSDANIPLSVASKGTGILYLGGGQTRIASNGSNSLYVSGPAGAVNYVAITSSATGITPSFLARGSDANVGLSFGTYNDANIDFYASGDPNAGTGKLQFRIAPTASAVNYHQLTGAVTGFGVVHSAQGTDTNIPLVLQPKGTGALQAQLTDSTATGGNARGANAVDWQTSRSAATQVASGSQSIVGGGIQNTSSNSFSVVCGGTGNTASGPASVVTGGQNSTASSTYSVAAGGGNVASGYASVVSGGYGNTAAGTFNFVGGGYINSANALAAVTTQSGTMNGTTAVTLSGSNANIKVGQSVTGTSIASFTYVAAISGTSLTLSQAASGSSTSTLSFFTPHGVVVGGGNNQATGSYSFVGGGGDAGNAANRNVANGDWSFIGGGAQNNASGANSSVLGGANCSSTSAFSVCLGGAGNSSSGFGSTNLGGNGNVANGTYSVASGFSSTNRSLSTFAYAAGTASRNGDAQTEIFVLRNSTTDATATVLTLGAGAASTTNQVILPNNSAYFFTGEVVAGVTGGGNTKGWTIEGVIKRGANAASTALVGTPTVTSMYADVGAATWAIAVTADTTNGGLAVTFTGQLATTIRVVAQIRTTEMTF